MTEKYARFIRSILVLAGVILLELALVLLFRENSRLEDGDTQLQPAEVGHRVLFISSYDPLYFTAADQRAGLGQGLYPAGIDFDAVYMDSKNYATEADTEGFRELLRARLSDSTRHYEAVITGDDAALRFAMASKDELFPELPVVFFGINDISLAEEAAARPDMTGLYESDFLAETMNLACELFPHASAFVALHDDSGAGLQDRDGFFAYAEKMPSSTFLAIDVQQMTHTQLIAALEEIPTDAVLLFMTCYTNRDGRVYSLREMTNLVMGHTNGVQIFRNYIGGEGEGVLGGVALDFKEHCRIAGSLVEKILDGEPVSGMQLIRQTPARCLFDYNLLNKNEILTSRLPADTVYINKPENFFRRYRSLFLPTVLIVAAMLLFFLSAETASRAVQRSAEELRRSRDDLERSEEIMRHRAEYDDFLDIMNRRTITERMKNDFTADSFYSVVMADLDNFQSINEDYGHSTADGVLKYLTELLRKLCDKNNWMIGRYGGDEYLFVMPDTWLTVDHPSVQMLLTLFRMPVPAGDTEARLSASLGISVSDGKLTPEQHIFNAEIAMYEAKARGRDRAVIFGDEMRDKVHEENRIKAALTDAFENDGFYMLYQPQIDARTKEVSGYEALVRMREKGIYPGQFIPVAEQNGWIWRIGRITTRLVIEQLAKWRDEGHALHPVSINYSSNQMGDTGYVDYIESLLKQYEIPAEYLEIEITEGIFLDRTAQANHLFERFQELGIRLLMDDFGTGYSSLGYLTYIPVDIIKLDKSLVDAYLVDGRDSFVRDVILLVHDLGKRIIIEGVEEEWQFARLCEFEADTIQGYYFSKPVPPDEAITFSVK